MPARIKKSELTFADPVRIKFDFAGLVEKHALSIMRDIVRDNWPEVRRPRQCVYVIRLRGEVAIAYPRKFSPVIYIGEGKAYSRLHKHTEWLAPLVMSVPQLSVEVRIVQVTRRNNVDLYKHIEADLIRSFSQEYEALPWFNRQHEVSKEGTYEYSPAAEKALGEMIWVGSGNAFRWGIQPTPNNAQHDSYAMTGVEKTTD